MALHRNLTLPPTIVRIAATSMERGTECPICYEEFGAGVSTGEKAPMRVEICGHVFCRKCITEHFSRQQDDCLCPMCRRNIWAEWWMDETESEEDEASESGYESMDEDMLDIEEEGAQDAQHAVDGDRGVDLETGDEAVDEEPLDDQSEGFIDDDEDLEGDDGDSDYDDKDISVQFRRRQCLRPRSQVILRHRGKAINYAEDSSEDEDEWHLDAYMDDVEM